MYRSGDEMFATKIGMEEESIKINNVMFFQYKLIPFRYFKTGGMASYYAMCLGKVNIASYWCTWCNLSVMDWESTARHTKG